MHKYIFLKAQDFQCSLIPVLLARLESSWISSVATHDSDKVLPPGPYPAGPQSATCDGIGRCFPLLWDNGNPFYLLCKADTRLKVSFLPPFPLYVKTLQFGLREIGYKRRYQILQPFL